MKNTLFGLLAALALALPLHPAPGLGEYLPSLPAWIPSGPTALYGPLNLFEYIDGAADNFLAYDFQELAVRAYQDDARRQLTVEIYRHASPLTAFGVYSSEKPLKGEYLSVGAQGYYEQGVLNFYCGSCYVKLSAFDLGDRDRSTLLAFAGDIARRIGAPAELPAELRLLPDLMRQPQSERFILRDFLGHPFLGSALMADYGADSKRFQLFVLINPDPAAARAQLQRWAALDKTRAGAPVEGDEASLQDPYNGAIRLLRRGPYLAGAINPDDTSWATYKAELRERLPESR